jgi:hypothetical protein
MKTRSRLPHLAVVVAFVMCSLVLGGTDASASSEELFKSPSGKINCGYFPAGFGEVASVSCEVSSYYGKVAPRPKDCDVDWVASGFIDKKGKVSTWGCQGDTIAGIDTKVIAYGTTWSKDGFKCASSTAGMRCTHKNGRGFSVSRSAVTKF